MNSHQSQENVPDVPAALPLSKQEVVTGPLPIKRLWFIDDWDPQTPRYHHISCLFNVVDVIEPGVLDATVTLLLHYHDMLRVRVTGKGGDWQLVVTDDMQLPTYWLDLSDIAAGEQTVLIEKVAYDLHTTIDPFAGPLFRVAYFTRGDTLPGQLLFIVYHGITDVYSQTILFKDLEEIYKQVKQGQEVVLPPKTTSFKKWSVYLANYVQEQLAKNHDWLHYYESLPWYKIKPLPADLPVYDDPSTIPEGVIELFLDRKTVNALRKWQRSLKMQLVEVFLTAFARAFARWTEGSALFIMLTDNGRFVLPELDVSRTLGPFIMSRWYFLDLSGCRNLEDMLLKTKQQMRSIPNRGLDLEFANYHIEHTELRKRIESLMNSYQIQFNFLSTLFQDKQEADTDSDTHIFCPTEGNIEAPWKIVPGEPFLPLYCMGALSQDTLKLFWRYDGKAYQQATMKRLAQYYIESLQEFASSGMRRIY